jgi:hypothetical protein
MRSPAPRSIGMLEVIFERPLRRHNPVDHVKMQSLALGHVGAFLGHGAFHKQYQERNPQRSTP